MVECWSEFWLNDVFFQLQFKVMVAGASGGIGQPLSLLLKQNPLVSNLALYDIAPVTPGVAVDLSHMDTPAKVNGYKGPDQLANAVSSMYLNYTLNFKYSLVT